MMRIFEISFLRGIYFVLPQAIALASNEAIKFSKHNSGAGSIYAPLAPSELLDIKKQVASYSRSLTSFVRRISYRFAYEADLNSSNTLKCGSQAFTGLVDFGDSSRSIKYPSHGLAEGLKAPSRYAAQRSVAEPSASSVRLL